MKRWLVRCCNRCNSVLNSDMQLDLSWRKIRIEKYLEEQRKVETVLLQGYGASYIAEQLDMTDSMVQKFRGRIREELERRGLWLKSKR